MVLLSPSDTSNDRENCLQHTSIERDTQHIRAQGSTLKTAHSIPVIKTQTAHKHTKEHTTQHTIAQGATPQTAHSISVEKIRTAHKHIKEHITQYTKSTRVNTTNTTQRT